MRLILNHGTSKKNKEKIIRHGFKIPSLNDLIIKHKDEPNFNYPWLGEGIYFYEDDYEQAKLWAALKFKSQADVVNCKLLFEDEELLDLDRRRDFTEFSKLYDEYREKQIKFCGNSYQFDPNNTLLFASMLLTILFPNVVIRYTFKNESVHNIYFDFGKKGNKIGTSGFVLSSRQVCVKHSHILKLTME